MVCKSGNSIDVFCVISEADRGENAGANMTFELDGKKVGEFFHQPSGETEKSGQFKLAYNVSVYANASIPAGNHTLRISSLGKSRVLFDYALYT